MTLMEQMMVVVVLGITSSIAIGTGRADRDQLQLDSAARRLQLGLNRARSMARREQRPCGISLDQQGWNAPDPDPVPGALRPCTSSGVSLQEVVDQGPVVLHTNLPAVLRVAANGLLLDGGIAVVSHQRLSTARCLVVSLPLGVSRIGFYRHPLPSQGAPLLSGRCRPDHT